MIVLKVDKFNVNNGESIFSYLLIGLGLGATGGLMFALIRWRAIRAARFIAGKDLIDDLGNFCAAFDHGAGRITDSLYDDRRGHPNNSDLRSGGARDP